MTAGIVWVALDGIGHPQDAPPGSVWEQPLPHLRPLVDGGRALDARLDVPGLPQSGTGQACWLSGQNAVALMGEHFGPQPGPTLQRLLRQHSLPVALTRAGGRAALLNVYAPAYLQGQTPATEPLTRSTRNRLGCFPFSFQAAGLPLNPPELPLVRAALGLAYEFPWEPVVPEQELSRLGEQVARAAQGYDLLVADLWLGDLLGHQGGPDLNPEIQRAGRAYLRRVDALLGGLLGAGARVVLSSDHGNLEDLNVKTHTLARVPFGGVGVELGQPRNTVEGGQVLRSWFGLA